MGSIPTGDTVKRNLRLLFAACVVALASWCGNVGSAPQLAHADEGDCGKLMPSEALEDFAFADGATGALTAAPAGAIPTVAAGGATVTLGTTMVLGAATVLSVFEVECRVLDWIEGDGAVIDVGAGLGPTLGSVTLGEPVACSTLIGFTKTFDICRQVSWPVSLPSGQYTWVSNFGTQWSYQTGLELPSNLRNASHNFFERAGSGVGLNYQPEIVFRSTQATDHWCKVQEAVQFAVSSLSSSVCSAAAASTWTPGLTTWIGYECGNNYGSVCGAEPGRLIMLQRCGNTGATPAPGGGGFCTVLPDVLLNPWPEVEETGWQRRVMVDVQCWDHDGDDSKTWVRYTGPTYWDTAPSARVRVPECPDVGDIPFKIHIGRVPTGLTPTIGLIPDGLIATKIEMPDAYDTTDYPDYLHCFGDRVTCDPPELDELTDTCTWATVTVDVDFCDPVKQAGPESPNPNTRGKPTTTEVIDPAPAPRPGEIIYTSEVVPEPPDDGEGGVTVNVPIDDGDGDRGGSIVFSPDEDECWPDGWGWFNPAEWVYRPIKCALVWAFVPEDPSGWVEDQWAELEDEVPFSYGAALVGFFDTVTDPTHAAAGTELWCAPNIPLPDYDAGGFMVDGGDTDACLDIEQAAAGAHATPLLDELLQWCLVGYVLYRFMKSTLGALL